MLRSYTSLRLALAALPAHFPAPNVSAMRQALHYFLSHPPASSTAHSRSVSFQFALRCCFRTHWYCGLWFFQHSALRLARRCLPVCSLSHHFPQRLESSSCFPTSKIGAISSQRRFRRLQSWVTHDHICHLLDSQHVSLFSSDRNGLSGFQIQLFLSSCNQHISYDKHLQTPRLNHSSPHCSPSRRN